MSAFSPLILSILCFLTLIQSVELRYLPIMTLQALTSCVCVSVRIQSEENDYDINELALIPAVGSAAVWQASRFTVTLFPISQLRDYVFYSSLL